MIGALILMVLVAVLVYAVWRLGHDQGRKEGYIKGIQDAIDIANDILEHNEQEDREYTIHIPEQ